MQTTDVKANGAVVFWQTASCDRRAMVTAMEAIFSGPDAARRVQPEDTNFRALKRAVTKRFQGGRGSHKELLIRASDLAVTVVREDIGAEENQYQTLHSFPVPVADENGGWNVAPADEIKAEFLAEKNCLDAMLVGKTITHLVERDLQGTRVRPAGGVYWVPESSLPILGKFAEVIESQSDVRIHLLRTVTDPAMIRAIHTAMQDEARALQVEVDAWLTDDENKDKKFPRRFQNAADKLAQKTDEYNRELDTALAVTKTLEAKISRELTKTQFVEQASALLGSL